MTKNSNQGGSCLNFLLLVWKLLEKDEKWHHLLTCMQWQSPWRLNHVRKWVLCGLNPQLIQTDHSMAWTILHTTRCWLFTFLLTESIALKKACATFPKKSALRGQGPVEPYTSTRIELGQWTFSDGRKGMRTRTSRRRCKLWKCCTLAELGEASPEWPSRTQGSFPWTP